MVRIKDRYLGFLYLAALIAIFIYILGIEVLLNKKYLLLDVPVGSVRTNLKAPDNFTRVADLRYCRNPLSNNTNFGSNLNTTLPCLYWDAQDVVYPIVEETAILASSRIIVTHQTYVCPGFEPSLCRWSTNSSVPYYIADLERFTLLIDHTMFSPNTNYQVNARGLSGSFYDGNGNAVKNFPSPNVFRQGEFDIFELNFLLKSVGVSLDDPSDLDIFNETYRYAGVLLLMFLSYDNTYSFNQDNIRYELRLKRVRSTEFKAVESIFDLTNNVDIVNRVTRNRHGVRIIFVQTGKIGRFDFQTLLLTWVSGLGLLAVATIVVDFLALNILPQKSMYQAYKFENTVDFSDFREGNPRAMAALPQTV